MNQNNDCCKWCLNYEDDLCKYNSYTFESPCRQNCDECIKCDSFILRRK